MRWLLLALTVSLGCRDTAPDLSGVQSGDPGAADAGDEAAPWRVDDVGPPDAPGPGGKADAPPGIPGGEGEGEGEPGPEDPPEVAPRPDPVAAPECDTRFRLALGRVGATVQVAGQWAGWDPAAGPMTDGNGQGVYETALPVPPGSWGYKLVIDGEWVVDPGHELAWYVDGTVNSRLDVTDCQAPVVRPVGTEVQGGVAVVTDSAGGRHRFEGLGPGRHDLAVGEGIAPVWIEDEPFDVRDGAIYFVFVDRFRNGDPGNDDPLGDPVVAQGDWQGGDLAGVLASLREGWFEALGVRTLWLSPVYEAFDGSGAGKRGRQYSGYHGYWPISARTIEPRFGTVEDLKTLTAEAHGRGIRVIVDLVWNQVHRDHEYFQAHPQWFRGDGSCVCGGRDCGWDERALDCWFTDYLPDVNWRHMGAVAAQRADALWWLTDLGVDGFRVDAVKHMEDIAVTTLRAAVQQELGGGNATFHLVGETFTGEDGRDLVARYVGPSRLHGQFDFPLFWTAVAVFARESEGMGALAAAVDASAQAYPTRWMSPFLGNHDVERFMSRAAGDLRGDAGEQGFDDPPGRPDDDGPFERTKLAFAWLLTQPGAPLIYYGDEVGMPGAGDPDNRRMMRFEGDMNPREASLLEHVRTWGRRRADTPALRRGALRTLHVGDDVYVYQRGTGPGAVVVGLNRSDLPRERVVQTEAGALELLIPARDAVVAEMP